MHILARSPLRDGSLPECDWSAGWGLGSTDEALCCGGEGEAGSADSCLGRVFHRQALRRWADLPAMRPPSWLPPLLLGKGFRRGGGGGAIGFGFFSPPHPRNGIACGGMPARLEGRHVASPRYTGAVRLVTRFLRHPPAASVGCLPGKVWQRIGLPEPRGRTLETGVGVGGEMQDGSCAWLCWRRHLGPSVKNPHGAHSPPPGDLGCSPFGKFRCSSPIATSQGYADSYQNLYWHKQGLCPKELT